MTTDGKHIIKMINIINNNNNILNIPKIIAPRFICTCNRWPQQIGYHVVTSTTTK